MRTDILQQAQAIRAKKQTETIKCHELIGHYFTEVT